MPRQLKPVTANQAPLQAAGLRREAMPAPPAEQVASHWLELCGLDEPGCPVARVHAALSDLRAREALRRHLMQPPALFIEWWAAQDVSDWSLTRTLGDAAWQLQVLERVTTEAHSVWDNLH